MTSTKANVIQYNACLPKLLCRQEYYPFVPIAIGMQTSNSWTRTNTTNNYLYNEGTELNNTTGIYETLFRGYDATLGRFMQIDPLAAMDYSTSPFAYARNNPALFNDPNGGQAEVPAGTSVSGYNRMLRTTGRDNSIQDFRSWYEDDGQLSSGIVNSLRALFPDATFSGGGSNGFWIKTWGVNTSGAGSMYGDATMLGELLNRYIFVSNISRDHFNSMTNSISQAIHQGQEAFANNPFGGGLLAFLSGGGLMGGGAIAGRALSAFKALRPLASNGLKQILTKKFAIEIGKNTLFEFGSQMLASGVDFEKSLSNMDIFDIATGARFSKYKGLALLAGAIDINYDNGLTFVFGTGDYNKNTLSAVSDGVIQFGIGSRSNSMPFIQEAILETVGGAAANKISESW